MRPMFVTALLTFLLDQAVKYVVLFQTFGLGWDQLRVSADQLPYPDRVDVFPPFLVLRMAWNRGINFGLFSGYDLRWVLIGIAIAVSTFVVWWVRRERPGRWAMLSAGLLVGGALANALDRVIYGAVADFLNMSCCGIVNPYAFNLADIAIFFGAVGLVLFGSEKKTA